MKRVFTFLLLIVFALSACKKSNNKSGCGTQQCAAIFTSAGVLFVNKDGSAVTLSEVTMINMRTGAAVKKVTYPFDINVDPGFVLVATDETKSDFSTEGDDVKVTAKNTKTGQVKSAIVKISGGCNCHVEVKTADNTVTFD